MVSRRNFFTIAILLAVMIFMFMFVSVIKQHFNQYDTNANGLEEETVEKLMDSYAERVGAAALDDSVAGTIFYLTGEGESPVDRVVESWGAYTGRKVYRKESLKGTSYERSKLPKAVVVNGKELTLEKDAEILKKLAEQGVTVIFASMPQPQVIEESDVLRELMGITRVYAERVWLSSMHLFSGLLIGSEAIYPGDVGQKNRQDREFQIPWYLLGTGTKTYMMGTVEDSMLVNNALPAILWRNTVGKGMVFCVNNEFMEHNFGLGILTAFLADADSYYLYPVVNAQNLVLADFGGFTQENSEELEALYNQPQINFFREQIWPTIIALNERTSARISMMTAIQSDYEDDRAPKDGMLVYYLRLLKESKGEAGISTNRLSATGLEEKLRQDMEYWNSEAGDYQIRSAYLADPAELGALKRSLPDVRTVVCIGQDSMPFGYLDDQLTVQMATSQGLEYGIWDDLLNKSLETALGYTCIVVDLMQATYPEDLTWEDLSQKLTRNLSTYWKDYRSFGQTTLAESDSRIRQFYALKASSAREGDVIRLHVDGLMDEAYFILRLHGEILNDSAKVPWQDLGNGFYLITVKEADTEIAVSKKKSFFYDAGR